MSNSTVTNNIEDWNVYRKLVVDSLKRLDEKTLELHQRLDQQSLKQHTLETKASEIDKLHERTDELADRIYTVSQSVASINSERTTEKVVRRILFVVGGGIWSILLIGASAWINHIFKM